MGNAVTTDIPLWFRDQMTRLMGLRFPPADLTTHWEGLRDLPDGVLESAVTRAQKTRVEFPTPAELRVDADLVKPYTTDADIERELDRSVPLNAPIDLGTLPTGLKLPMADRIWRYYCEDCSDTGTLAVWCGKRMITEAEPRQPWMPIDECGTYNCKQIKAGHLDYGHEWHKPCPCRDSNPALMRKRDAAKKYAEKPGKA